MSADEERRVVRIAPESPNQLVVRDKVNVLVLIGGTTEAGNLGGGHRSAGYSRAGVAHGDPSYWALSEDELHAQGLTDSDNWYWEDNADLREAVMQLHAQYTNLRIFTAHGWSGDNSPFNREVAGKYLADRLCGANGENAYYQALLSREVHFHVLGHSHGGNVLNEFAKEAAAVWPARWKIRTVVYLSTPFFRNLHRIDTGAFHSDCKIVNVANEFDITQRVLADFNLFQLNGALELAGLAELKSDAAQMASAIGQAADGLKESIEPMLRSLHIEGVHTFPFELDPAIRFDPAHAAPVYDQLFAIFDSLRPLLRSLRRSVRRLHRGVEYPAATEFVGRVCQGRQVLSVALVTRWLAFIDELKGAVDTTCMQLTSRRQSGVYSIGDVVSDLESPTFLSIARLLRVHSVPGSGGLSSPLTDLIVDTVLEQIDVFDNTVTSPAQQLAGTSFADKLVEVDVSPADALHSREAEAAAARRFLDRLSEIEARYEASRSPTDIVDLLLTVVAHVPAAFEAARDLAAKSNECTQYVDAVHTWMPGFLSELSPNAAPSLLNIVRAVGELFQTFWFWSNETVNRHLGNSMVQPPIKSPQRNRPRDPFVGELPYFALVSHSQSRFALYPDVRSQLEAQFTTRRRRVVASSAP